MTTLDMVDAPFLSVVMPVYNLEERIEYFETCLASICGQSYDNIEIILVNDGSTDNTQALLTKVQAKDKRIRILQCALNRGSGYARNVGVEQARAGYVWFVDSDDFLPRYAVEILENTVERATDKPDMLCIGHSSEWFEPHSDNNYNFLDPRVQYPNNEKAWKYEFTGAYALDRFFYYDYVNDLGFGQEPWLRILSLRLARQALFNRLSAGQDVAHAITCYSQAQRVSYLDGIMYIQRKHDNSVTVKHTHREDLAKSSFIGHLRVYDTAQRAIERYQLRKIHNKGCSHYLFRWQAIVEQRSLNAGPDCAHMIDWYHPHSNFRESFSRLLTYIIWIFKSPAVVNFISRTHVRWHRTKVFAFVCHRIMLAILFSISARCACYYHALVRRFYRSQ